MQYHGKDETIYAGFFFSERLKGRDRLESLRIDESTISKKGSQRIRVERRELDSLGPG
jgi:hypothetical protein